MLTLISSIPTTVCKGFDVQDLPLRATPVSVEQISEVFGGICGKQQQILPTLNQTKALN